MKEFMLLIRNTEDSKSKFSEADHLEFVNSCKSYIGELTQQGKLIASQPMIREGYIISGTPGAWASKLYKEGNEVIVGYYHILATDIDDAVAIAKGNPEFAYTTTARVEVRPIKMKEDSNAFVYPTMV